MKNILLMIMISLMVSHLAHSRELTLANCRQVADDHFKPLKLAQEEISVRQAKQAEAARALWPGLKIKGEFTDGASIVELGTPGFSEASYGVQLSQTLFSGGKLWSTYQQAKVNRHMAEVKLLKTKLDMTHQLKEAYWNLVRVNDNQSNYQQAVKQGKRYVAMAEKLFQDGTINKRILLATKTHRNSASYQQQSAAADLIKYKWNLAAAMGLDKPQDWQLNNTIPYYPSEITLEQCLEQALQHNPDYLHQQLSSQAARYEKRIHQSLDWPKIELNGFYGRSGGAYDSEELDLNEDYNISIKLTQNLVWNPRI